SSTRLPEPPLDEAFRTGLRRQLMQEAWSMTEGRSWTGWWSRLFAPPGLAWAGAVAGVLLMAAVAVWNAAPGSGGFNSVVYVANPVSFAAPNAFERAWRKAGCLAGRGDGPDRAVVKRLVIGLLHQRKGWARRRALKGRRCHGDRPRWSVLAICVAGRGPARLHPPRQDRGADVRRGQDRRDRSHDRAHACRLGEGKGCVGDQRRDLYER